MKLKRVLHCNVTVKLSIRNQAMTEDCDVAAVGQMVPMRRRGRKAGHGDWNGIDIHPYTHIYTHMLVYINRYSVKTGGTVTLGSHRVRLSVGTKHDQWQVVQ